MKRLMKNALAAMLCAALLLGLATAATDTAPNVYLMAVNEKLVEMTADNMPMVVGGTLYVPYTMLSSRVSGINLGVSAQYSTTRQTVLVSSGQRAVTFDTRANTCYDLQGNPQDAWAVVRNTMVYLPLAWVCNYFGTITYTTTRTRYGTLVRVTNNAVILSDAEFVDAADNQLRDNLRRYEESVRNQGSTGINDPTPSNQPESGPLVYLAFLWGEQAEAVAQRLEASGQRGLFLFTGEELAEQDDLVRRLVGAGHLVGLNLTGDTGEECLRQAEEWAGLLSDIARCAVCVVRADNLAQEEQGWLGGYAIWRATATGEEYSSASGLLRSLSAGQANYVELSCDETGAALLASALRSLAGSGYRLRQAVAPALGG